ncbi:hypothetical protein wCauBTS_15100 [Wolbachia pipientis]
MLLPLNATKQEQALVDAIDYKIDPSRIRGFKFSLKEETLPWIIEEYGLEPVRDLKKRIG